MSIRNKLLSVAVVLIGVVAFMVWNRAHLSRPNVILIVVDTLRADHLSCYGYERKTSPVIDAFADENLKFDLAMATAPWTAPSVASIFTGLYPTAHGVGGHASPEQADQERVRAAVLDQGFETLAEALRRNGYSTGGVTGNAWVADYLGFAQGFDEFTTLDYRPAALINSHAVEIIKKLAGQPQPFLFYVHYMDPHGPYRPPKGLLVGLGEPLREAPHIPSERGQIDLYDGEIRYVDSQIGILFDQLRAWELFRDAVIVLVSDHGEQFREHGETGHGQNVFNYLVHVPLILKAPGLQGRVEEAVSILDIYPTILELTHTKPGFEVDGASLLRAAQTNRPGVLSESTRGRNQKAFTRSDGKKLILAFNTGSNEVIDETQELEPVGLFDIPVDFYEKNSLQEDDGLLDVMRSAFYAIYRDSVGRRPVAEPQDIELRPETVRQLKSLGYLK
jgi:arylsulfatase A-like enzyme